MYDFGCERLKSAQKPFLEPRSGFIFEQIRYVQYLKQLLRVIKSIIQRNCGKIYYLNVIRHAPFTFTAQCPFRSSSKGCKFQLTFTVSMEENIVVYCFGNSLFFTFRPIGVTKYSSSSLSLSFFSSRLFSISRICLFFCCSPFRGFDNP